VSTDYHMIKYIHESPDALQRTLDRNESVIQSLVARAVESGIRRVIIVGMGSSYTAAVMAAPVFYYHAALPVYIMPASELPHYAPRLVDRRTLVVSVSRSGERGQAIDALKDAVRRGALSVAMTGVSDSLLAQTSQLALITSEGPEITFPKTKSVITSTGLLMRLALALAAPEDSEAVARLYALQSAPHMIRRTIEATEEAVRRMIPALQIFHTVRVAGSGSNYGTAMEGAMKIQEAASIVAHATDLGNLLHDPLGVANEGWLIIPLISLEDQETGRTALELVGKFGARRLAVAAPGFDVGNAAEYMITLPEILDSLLNGLLYLPPLQLLAYYWAVTRGLNPDAPASMHTTLSAVLAPGRKEPEL
jgi:glucosamine--fructose-6-phosphate aminotransferase (isomerizing)